MNHIQKIILFLLTVTFATTTAFSEIFPSEVTIEKRERSTPRNVIFILSDDHRYDAMGFMGHPFLETPHMDSIAANGTHLENAFVTTSLCSPSRASILTGLYTHKHRVIDNHRAEPADILYFPQYLQEAGYETAYIGKWHMGDKNDNPRPGFDHWVSFAGQGNYWTPGGGYTLNLNGKRVPQEGYITDELTNYAIDWIKDRDGDAPFFLYLSHKAVHANFTPAPRHEGRYEDASWPRSPSQNLEPELAALRPRWLQDQRNSWHGIDFPYHSDLSIDTYYKRYCETLLAVDDSIGRVMEQLKAMDLYEDTLVIYMGDNGFMFGEHGLIDKRVAYEASIRVPMIMQCPSLFEGGKVVNEVVANIDIAPTILEAAGIHTPAHMDGASMIPLAQEKPTSWRENFLYVYYWENSFPQSPTVFALRQDRFKYINYYGIWDTNELYDLKNDPHETVNLINNPAYKQKAKTMQTQLFDMLADAGGLNIPLNPPSGFSANKRYLERGGDKASPFPAALVLEEPENTNAK
jgi:N-acetylglucosamine-6-sulfatase